MREAVIVSTARTPIGKAYRGAFNDTPAQTLGGHAIGAAVGRAGVAGAEVDDVVMGAAMQQGATGVERRAPMRVARGAADQRRRHVGRPAMRLGPDGDRHRGQADRRRRHADRGRRRPGVDLAGAERPHEPLSRGRSLAAPASRRRLHVDAGDGRDRRRALPASRASGRTNMRCNRSSAPRAAQAEGRFDAEIVPLPSVMKVRRQGERGDARQAGHADARRRQSRRHDARRARRPEAGVRGRAAFEDGRIVHHRRQRLAIVGRRQRLRADGGQSSRAQRDLEPLGIYRGIAVAGCDPDEMGIGPVFAVPKLLERARPEGRRHRPVGTQRGLRGAGDLLPRPARHRRRQAQRRRRRDRRSAIPTA